MIRRPGDEFVTGEPVDDADDDGMIDPGGPDHLVIQVESMNKIIADFTARDVRVEAPSSSEDAWTSWTSDPDDHRIELVRELVGHPEGMTAADFGSQLARHGRWAPRVLL